MWPQGGREEGVVLVCLFVLVCFFKYLNCSLELYFLYIMAQMCPFLFFFSLRPLFSLNEMTIPMIAIKHAHISISQILLQPERSPIDGNGSVQAVCGRVCANITGWGHTLTCVSENAAGGAGRGRRGRRAEVATSGVAHRGQVELARALEADPMRLIVLGYVVGREVSWPVSLDPSHLNGIRRFCMWRYVGSARFRLLSILDSFPVSVNLLWPEITWNIRFYGDLYSFIYF